MKTNVLLCAVLALCGFDANGMFYSGAKPPSDLNNQSENLKKRWTKTNQQLTAENQQLRKKLATEKAEVKRLNEDVKTLEHNQKLLKNENSHLESRKEEYKRQLLPRIAAVYYILHPDEIPDDLFSNRKFVNMPKNGQAKFGTVVRNIVLADGKDLDTRLCNISACISNKIPAFPIDFSREHINFPGDPDDTYKAFQEELFHLEPFLAKDFEERRKLLFRCLGYLKAIQEHLNRKNNGPYVVLAARAVEKMLILDAMLNDGNIYIQYPNQIPDNLWAGKFVTEIIPPDASMMGYSGGFGVALQAILTKNDTDMDLFSETIETLEIALAPVEPATIVMPNDQNKIKGLKKHRVNAAVLRRELINYLQKNGRTVENHLKCMKTLLPYLLEKEIVRDNPYLLVLKTLAIRLLFSDDFDVFYDRTDKLVFSSLYDGLEKEEEDYF